MRMSAIWRSMTGEDNAEIARLVPADFAMCAAPPQHALEPLLCILLKLTELAALAAIHSPIGGCCTVHAAGSSAVLVLYSKRTS